MAELKLFYYPLSCAFVTLTALEKVGCEYDLEVIDLFKGEQHSAEFLKLNPDAKVPTLVVDGKVLTENAAILWWLHNQHPEAKLFPDTEDQFERSSQLSTLIWISSTWHPSGRANMAPQLWTTADVEPVREKGRELMQPLLRKLEDDLEGQDWYYGKDWSIIDVYFYFGYNLAFLSGLDLAPYPNIMRHKERVEAYSAFKAADEIGKAILAEAK